MKILYIASSGGPGGASVALFNLINGLYLKESIYVFFPNKGSFSNQIESLGIKCFYFPYSLTVYPKFQTVNQIITFPFSLLKICIRNYKAYKYLLEIAKKINPEIIHTNVGPLDIGFKVAKKLIIRHIWHIREYQDLDFNLHFLPSKTKFLKKLSNPINYSIAITNDVFKYWKLNKKKDTVIYDGVIKKESRHGYYSNKKNYFLFVGRLDDAKGVKNLIKIFSHFTKKNNDYNLLLAGKGKNTYIKECQELLKKYRISNKVKFLGHRDDVYHLMEEAKALVVPSRYEGFGFITAEAMFNHCLVIGKNTAGTREQFDNGQNYIKEEIGYRFNSDQEFLDALISVSGISPDNYDKIIHNAYKAVTHLYKIDEHVTMVKNFYKTIK